MSGGGVALIVNHKLKPQEITIDENGEIAESKYLSQLK